MKKFALAVAVAAAFPMVRAQPAADPADPAPPVPEPAYRSVFQHLPTGVEEEQLDWKHANADVAQFPRGHGDYLKWEEAQSGAAKPAAPAAAPVPTPAAPRPQGHRHH